MCDCKLSYCGAGLFGYIPYEMQTFDSVCCDLVKNSNIVTVFSTYINIICTRQQTGLILSLATLTPPNPSIINLFLFLPLSFPQPQPTLPPTSQQGLGSLSPPGFQMALVLELGPSDTTRRSI